MESCSHYDLHARHLLKYSVVEYFTCNLTIYRFKLRLLSFAFGIHRRSFTAHAINNKCPVDHMLNYLVVIVKLPRLLLPSICDWIDKAIFP